jgi:hypothetical protein
MRSIIVVVLMFAAACGSPDGSQYYPPLHQGERRDYEIVVTPQGGTATHDTVSTRGDGNAIIRGKTYWKEVRGTIGVTGYYRQTSDGIYSITDTSAATVEQLVLPLPLVVGKSWTKSDGVDVLHFAAAAIEDVNVDGRPYHQCMKITISGSAHGQTYNGTQYYAPGIGLVLDATQWPGLTTAQLLLAKKL